MRKLLLFFAIVFSLSSYAQQEVVPGVSVVGEASVSVVPDKVLIRTRVEHSGESAQEVKTKNDKVVSEVLKYLKSKGIPAKNVRTDYVRLNKEYDYGNKKYFYSANQAISIQLDEIERYEEIMEGLMSSGLNRIDGVEFKTSKEEELKAEARKKAVVNAKQKAEEYASALDQKIGAAFLISELGGNNYQPVYRAVKLESFDSAAEQTLAPGEMEVTVKVNVSFHLL